jgi:hypothetical protein
MMNKELKEAIDAVICSTVCDSLDTSDLAWGVKRKLHQGIQAAIWDYLHESPAQYTAALQSQLQEKNPATYDLEKEIKKSVDAWYRKSEVDVRGDLGNRMFNIARAYAASLQESEIAFKPKETFTARDARTAALKARTYEGFLQGVMSDINYQAECGKDIFTVIANDGSRIAGYLTRLASYLRSIGFEVTRSETEVKRNEGKAIRIRLVIKW